MPRPRTVYRGKRKYSWIITLVVFVLVVLILVSVWLFSYLQRYIVYDKESLQLVLPSERASQPVDTDTQQSVTVPKVDVEIVMDRTDYSDLTTNAGTDLIPLHGLFVSAEDLTEQNLQYYLGNMGDFNALVLELKGSDGFLRYHSSIPLTDSYGVNGDLELGEILGKLKSKDVYLVAQISALVDETMATRNGPIALKNAVTGIVFQNSKGAWLDPYSETARAYLTDLLRELQSLGFDEVLLDGLYCPSMENLQFSQDMTMTPDTISAVGSLAFYLRETADEIGIRLSAAAESEALAAGESASVGQDFSVFFKLFDRVAYDTADVDPYICMNTLKETLGSADADLRIVPAAENYALNHGSYIVK